MAPKKQTFKVRVADKATGDERIFEIKAGSQMEAEAKCGNADWLVVAGGSSTETASIGDSPKRKLSVSDLERSGEIIGMKTSLWSPPDPIERAVVRGIVKAWILIVTISIIFGVVVAILMAIAADLK